MQNTDHRISIEKPVTPAFLIAALLWHPVKERAEALMAGGMPEIAALGQAADEVMANQVQRTAIPRRFSVISRQIWTMQPRFNNKHGRRAKSLMSERRFRAAYDFLLLRAVEDPSLKSLCDHWTEAQKGVVMNTGQNDRFKKDAPRRRRRPRRRKTPAGNS
jgi:poly(A) polymerase